MCAIEYSLTTINRSKRGLLRCNGLRGHMVLPQPSLSFRCNGQRVKHGRCNLPNHGRKAHPVRWIWMGNENLGLSDPRATDLRQLDSQVKTPSVAEAILNHGLC